MSDYWDLDDIMAEQTRLKCHFQTPAYRYGFLLSTNDTTLPVKSVVDLPFWWAAPLALDQRVDLESPLCFGDPIQDDLIASATGIKLSMICPAFFMFASKILRIMETGIRFPKLVVQAFVQRLQLLCTHAQSSHSNSDSTFFLQTLDSTERHLYEMSVQSEDSMQAWLRRDHLRRGALGLQRQQQRNKRRRTR